MHLNLIFELQRMPELRRDLHPWPANRMNCILPGNGKPQRPEKGVFGHLHIPKEAGEMDDPSHIGLRELNAVGHFEFVRHLLRLCEKWKSLLLPLLQIS